MVSIILLVQRRHLSFILLIVSSVWVVFCNNLALNAAVNLVPVSLQEGAADGLLVKFRINSSMSSQLHALSASGLRSVQRFELVPGLIHVKPVAGENAFSTLSSIQSNPNVEYAEPNYFVSIEKLPNDPDFISQYGLQNSGQSGGLVGADISAPASWDLATGNDVIVAVIDTGVEYTHSELQHNMWMNPGEIAGNNLDDDNNGFIDDVYGWDFSNDDADPMDDMGHGTHVAGIIAAEGNNNIGITGINWKARIMALKFIAINGIGTTSKAIKALNYAVAMGARVSNNSWGGGGYSQALFDSIAAAEKAGHIFVAASGNKGLDTDDPVNAIHYPSSYPMDNVISTTATDEFDNLSGFSNYGVISVDVAAPGRQIKSLWVNNSYISLDGTSMAAPFVTGAVSLLWSTNASLSVNQIRSAILNNTDELPSLSGLTVTGGRLNLFKALQTINMDISIVRERDFLSVNETLNLSAIGGTPPYIWSVNDERIATIDANRGILTAISSGTVAVSVIDSRGLASDNIKIVVEDLILEPELAFLNVGDQLQYKIKGGVSPYSWSSTNSQVAIIDQDSGLLTAISAGQTQISVTDVNNVSVHTGAVEVVFVPDLSISSFVETMVIGDQSIFTAQGGVPPYEWTTSNPLIASVDGVKGNVTALSPGIVQVSVQDSSGMSQTTEPITIQDIFISVNSSTMKMNEIQRLTVFGGSAPYEWFVSNSLVANVDSFGNLTALASGSVKVSVRDVDGLLASTEMILVTDSTALTMTMDASILTIDDFVNVTIKGGVTPYEWRSSNASVLNIDPTAGGVRAIGTGMAYVSITDAVGDVVSSAVVEVRDITILSSNSTYTIGDTDQFFASGGSTPYRWQVNDSAVASIDLTGLFRANSQGTATIGVIDADGVRGESKTITVNPRTVSAHTIELVPRSATLSKRSTTTIIFVASGGLEPYRFSLSNDIGSINNLTGEFSSQSAVSGSTKIIVIDADGHTVESGVIDVR